MKRIFLHVILLLVHILYVLSRELPSFVHVCKRNDPNLSACVLKTVQEMRPHLEKGIPEMDLPPYDPLHFIDISVSTGKGTSVSLHAKLSNGVIYGFKDFVTNNFKANLEEARFATTFYFPNLRIQANYEFKGSVLLFEVNSKGKSDLNATNSVVDVEWFGTFYTKNNKQHLKFEKIKVNPQIEKMNVYFSNLFEGNDVLTETVNNAINENIDSLVEDVRPIMEETISQLCLDFYNRVYKLYPLEQLFPE